MSNGAPKICEKEIENIFKRAISKLDEIELHANKEKRQVVKELAIELEGKIPIDTICIEIVTQLRGKVSERFVRECLEAKYKQGSQMVNAKKQKERSKILAAVTPLNQKTTIVTLANENSGDPVRIATDNVSVEEIHDDNSSLICPNCKNLMNQLSVERAEKSELAEALSKATRMVPAEELLDRPFTALSSTGSTEVIRFSIIFGELRKQMASLFNEIGDLEKLEFLLEVNTQTFEPLAISVTASLDHDGEQILRLPEADF